jgi:hypothetical protein
LLSSLSQVSSSLGFVTVLWFKNVRAALDPKLVCLQETKLATITPQTAAEVLGHRFNDFKYLPAQPSAQEGNHVEMAHGFH